MNNRLYKLMNWAEIEEITYSESSDPHLILGPHKEGSKTLLQAFFPGAEEVTVQWDFDAAKKDFKEKPMELADEDGFFAVLISLREMPPYRFEVKYPDKRVIVCGDPYRHKPVITAKDIEKFTNGIAYSIYDKLGAHPMTLDGDRGTYFAVWAPAALRVSVVGDFNAWNNSAHQMRRLPASGIFELFIPDVEAGAKYSFDIKLKSGASYKKADPFAFSTEISEGEAVSIVTDTENFKWTDQTYIAGRRKLDYTEAPVSICEINLSRFKASKGSQKNSDYKSLATEVAKYVKELNCTHIELMPIAEYKDDNGDGYDTLSFFAPTKRYGAPAEFAGFVNELHKAGIGVILDFNPSGFEDSPEGLRSFDGTALFEHEDYRRGWSGYLNMHLYNYGRPEVSDFLISAGFFWIDKYHIDGLKFSNVSAMLYNNYRKNDGDWLPNMYGGVENLEAIEYIKHFNSVLKKRFPGVMTIAEEEAAYPRVTAPLDEDGLGFNYKLNNGFIDDYMNYIGFDPIFRSGHHGELVLSMVYNYAEHFVIPFSHKVLSDEEKTLLHRMPGTEEEKLSNLRLTLSYLFTHPGKKLIYAGEELKEDEKLRRLTADLNGLYKSERALYLYDDSPDGFEWINNFSANENYISFVRKTWNPEDMLVVVANFSGIPQTITTGVPFEGKYKEIFNSDAEQYGGSNVINTRVKKADDVKWDDRTQSISVKLAALSLSILKFTPYTEEELEKVIVERIKRNTPIMKAKTRQKASALKGELVVEKVSRKTAEKKEKLSEGKIEKNAGKSKTKSGGRASGKVKNTTKVADRAKKRKVPTEE